MDNTCEDKIKQELIEKIILELLEKKDELTIIKHWGENCIQLCDVINLINNVAGTDFRRYFTYDSKIKYSDCNLIETNDNCSICENYWRQNPDNKGCYGIKNNEKIPCEKFKNMLQRY